MSLSRCWSNVFLGTIVAQQLAPSDPIPSDYTRYPSHSLPHTLQQSNLLGGGGLVKSCIVLAPMSSKIIRAS
jgi:hypothetical protein